MAGAHPTPSILRRQAARAYTPSMSEGWKPLGFTTMTAGASLPGASATGRQDIRNPVLSNRIFTVGPGNWQGAQLRQYQSLLSRTYNISYASGILAEFKPAQVQLAGKNGGITGLGLGKLKNLNVKATPKPNNLLALATSFGRASNKIPSS
jgi:hypothetical protein